MLEDLRVLVANIMEIVLQELSDSAVLECDDGGGSQTVVDKRDLAEELTLAQDLKVGVIVRLRLGLYTTLVLSFAEKLRSALGVEVAVAEVNHYLTLGDHIKRYASLKLLNDHVIGRQQLSLHLLHDGPDENLFGLCNGGFREGMCPYVSLGKLLNG